MQSWELVKFGFVSNLFYLQNVAKCLAVLKRAKRVGLARQS